MRSVLMSVREGKHKVLSRAKVQPQSPGRQMDRTGAELSRGGAQASSRVGTKTEHKTARGPSTEMTHTAAANRNAPISCSMPYSIQRENTQSLLSTQHKDTEVKDHLTFGTKLMSSN